MKPLPIIAVILSGIALVVALTQTQSLPSSGSSGNAALEKQIKQLEQEIQSLQATLKNPALTTPSSNSNTSDSALSIAASPDDTPASPSDLAVLKRSLDPYGVIQSTQERIEKARLTLLDTSLTGWERARQADLLKQYGQFDAEAIASMRDLLANSENPHDKAAAVVALRGHVTPDMRDEIITAMNTTTPDGKPAPRLTYHGIEALEPLLPDPVVEEWMLNVAETDPEPKIAKRAAQSIGAEIQWETDAAKNR
ncbi:MAG: hypothetical protein AAF591_00485 [Verrucomicrobiota bacterium]